MNKERLKNLMKLLKYMYGDYELGWSELTEDGIILSINPEKYVYNPIIFLPHGKKEPTILHVDFEVSDEFYKSEWYEQIEQLMVILSHIGGVIHELKGVTDNFLVF